MKKIFKVMAVGVVALGFNACSMKTIQINKLDDGSIQYSLNYKVKPDITARKYRGYNIHDYYIDFASINNKNEVKVKLIHDISFTQGTGTLPEGYVKKYLYNHFENFNLGKLKTDSKVTKYDYEHAIFVGYSEVVLKTYPKKEFIKKVLNNQVNYIEIKTNRGYLTSFATNAKSPTKIQLKGLDKLKKFALCLKDSKYCVDKEK